MPQDVDAVVDRLGNALKWQADCPLFWIGANTRDRLATQKRTSAYMRNRTRRDPAFRIMLQLRGRMRAALRAARAQRGNGHFSLLGCTAEYVMAYLEERWSPGMSWENYGAWHIDHIRPCATFNLLDPGEQARCFHYTNLQPLWKADNLRKSAKSYFPRIRKAQ